MAQSDPVGAKLYIGPVSLASTISQFEALSWVEVGSIETIPQFGPTYNVTKYTPIADGLTRKKKGARDNGDPELVCFLDNLDVGQMAMLAAVPNKAAFAFKMVVPDAPPEIDEGEVTTPSVYYFLAYVTGATNEVGSADNIQRRRFGLAITTDVLEDPATDVEGDPGP